MTDELGHTGWLMGELFKLSQQVSSYAVRMLGTDIERAGPLNAQEEFQMGSRLIELGTMVQAQANERLNTVGDDSSESATDTLVTELMALKHMIPSLCTDMINGIIPQARQAEFGWLLIKLGVRLQRNTPNMDTES